MHNLQVIINFTWTKIDLSSNVFYGIRLKEI